MGATPKGSTQLQEPNVRRRLVESPESSKISTKVESNRGENPNARSNAQIEIKREFVIVHAIDNSDGSNCSQIDGIGCSKQNAKIRTTSNGYIKLCLLNIELRHLVVCSSINRKTIATEETESNVCNNIEVIHSILHTNTIIGAEVEADSKICF